VLRPDDFYEGCSRTVFECALKLDGDGVGLDVVTLAAELNSAGKLHQVGGSQFLSELIDGSPTLSNVDDHIALVKEHSRRRKLIATCRIYAARARDRSLEVDQLCSDAERDVLAATDSGVVVDRPQKMSELVPEAITAITERQNGVRVIPGVSSGLRSLDRLLSGGLKRNLYIVAGRPGMGKSALAFQIALSVARGGKSAVFESVEMPKEQLVLRALSAESLVGYHDLETQPLSREQWNSVINASVNLSKLPLSLSYCPGSTMQQIRARARGQFARLKREHGTEPGLVAIDYAQLLSGDRNKNDTRENEVSSISRRAMALPSEFGCPVLLLSQLNREVEKRPNKRPTLADLRESGALEQDAYGIIFLYRDELYNEASEDRGMAEIILAKHRNGSTGWVKTRFHGETTSFIDLTASEEADDAFSRYDD
jgi:replicative DNA helicase